MSRYLRIGGSESLNLTSRRLCVVVTHALRVLIVFLCGSSVSSGSRKTKPVSGISPGYKLIIRSMDFIPRFLGSRQCSSMIDSDDYIILVINLIFSSLLLDIT